MSHERRDLAIGTGHRYTPVDSAREVGDPVFEIMVSDLHHVGFVLDNGDGGGERHFTGGGAEAVLYRVRG